MGRNVGVVDPSKLHQVEAPTAQSVGPPRTIGRNPKGNDNKVRDEDPVQEAPSMMDVVLALSSSSDTARAARARRELEEPKIISNARMNTRLWVEGLETPDEV